MTTEIFSLPGFFTPQLSLVVQAALRASYGILLFATLAINLPHWKRFFLSERWGGYAKSSLDVDLIQNPIVTCVVCAVWFVCSIMLIIGSHPVIASGINLILCYYFFVHMRWKGILRGFGAPGFMTYWTGLVVFLLELTSHYAPEQRTLALLVAQVDFAFIMLSSGLYKFTAGYAQNNGMEFGMVSPQWGYWWKFYKNISSSNILFRVLNHLAWSTEVVAALLMLNPQTRFIGGVLILVSFIFIATQIRLGVLCEMVIVDCFLFFHLGSIGDKLLAFFAGAPAIQPNFSHANIPILGEMLTIALWAYLILLPLAHAGLFYNFYAHKALPDPLQRILERYTNFFGIIIWRVFSADHTNFFPMVYRKQKDSNERELVSRYGWQGGLRYNHVGESIVLTCLFTTLKYYASNQNLFNERLLRYARTVKCPQDCLLEFEYNSIRKIKNSFEYVPIATYTVDVLGNKVSETIIDPSSSVNKVLSNSPVHEGVRPGSYVSLGR